MRSLQAGFVRSRQCLTRISGDPRQGHRCCQLRAVMLSALRETRLSVTAGAFVGTDPTGELVIILGKNHFASDWALPIFLPPKKESVCTLCVQ
jgi:hypothetical protein